MLVLKWVASVMQRELTRCYSLPWLWLECEAPRCDTSSVYPFSVFPRSNKA
jgi:hypothetical protein